MCNVFLGLPTYDGKISAHAALPIAMAVHPRSGARNVAIVVEQGSVTPFVMNRLWMAAIADGQWDYFVMLHADVAPEPDWLAILLAEIQRLDADVVSTVIPEKNPTGVTSTALSYGPDQPARRVTLKELDGLPQTFDNRDLAELYGVQPTWPLLINTGCWIANLRRPWVERITFDFVHQLSWNTDGEPLLYAESEDWFISRTMHDLGAQVYATQKVKATHFSGDYRHANQGGWGTWSFDQDWAAAQAALAKE